MWLDTQYGMMINCVTCLRPAIPHLEETNGRIIVISAEGGILRIPGASDYHISKHAGNRLVEYIALGPSFYNLLH